MLWLDLAEVGSPRLRLSELMRSKLSLALLLKRLLMASFLDHGASALLLKFLATERLLEIVVLIVCFAEDGLQVGMTHILWQVRLGGALTEHQRVSTVTEELGLVAQLGRVVQLSHVLELQVA